MNRQFIPRFTSAAAALRFFFRISALFCGAAIDPRLQPHRMTRNGLACQHGAFGDYLRIGACVRDLSEAQFHWLCLCFGPAWFTPRSRLCAHEWGEPASCAIALSSRPIPGRMSLRRLRARLQRRRLVAVAPALRDGHFSRSAVTWAATGRDRENLRR